MQNRKKVLRKIFMNSIIYLILMAICSSCVAQKIFQDDTMRENWQYIYPFKDKSFVLAIQQVINPKDSNHELPNALLSFGKKGAKSDQVFWKKQLRFSFVEDNVKYEDFNNDGVKDVLFFEASGGRGANEYYNLFLVNEKNHTLTKVNGFNGITNPTYHKKHKVILGYGFVGANYYSIYRINKNNRVYKIGESFEDENNLDLDQKITELLKRKK